MRSLDSMKPPKYTVYYLISFAFILVGAGIPLLLPTWGWFPWRFFIPVGVALAFKGRVEELRWKRPKT